MIKTKESYNFKDFKVSYSTSESKIFTIKLELEFGEFYVMTEKDSALKLSFNEINQRI